MNLSIIVPVYNEEATIVEAVSRAVKADLPVDSREVIVVDDCSRDRTREILRSHAWPPEVMVIELEANHGKGYAIRKGVERATGTYIAILDADTEYDPRDFAEMIHILREEEMDAVIGTRVWRAHSAYGYWYVMGNRAINTVCNILYNTWLSDFGACLKVLPRELFQSLQLRENGFGFDAELVARLLRRRAGIYEIPIRYRARSRAQGKKINALDGVRILGVFIRCRLR